MGLFRKATSALTLGLVDFRSDKERIARYTKGARHEARRQTGLMQAQQQRVGPPPGWYADPQGLPVMRWWDGFQWTGATQPR